MERPQILLEQGTRPVPEYSIARCENQSGQLAAEHVEAFDRRCLRQQVGRVRTQRLRDSPVEVSLAAGIVGECIEDAEGEGAELQGKPNRSGAFLACQVEAGLQELSLPGSID
jgi:hypothetical protein